MVINTNTIVPMTDANQNFSKVVRLVDKEGMAVIMKNNRPKYIVVDFDEYEELSTIREERKRKIDETADKIIEDNLEAFKELAK
jgi:antitoxin Phd